MPENHGKSEVITDQRTDRPTDRHSELESRVHANKNESTCNSHSGLHLPEEAVDEPLELLLDVSVESLAKGRLRWRFCFV